MRSIELFGYRNVYFVPTFIHCFVATKDDYCLLFGIEDEQDSYWCSLVGKTQFFQIGYFGAFYSINVGAAEQRSIFLE